MTEFNNTYNAERTLINELESRFQCELGPAKASFEFPQRDEEPVRVTYVVYAVRGPDLDEAVEWFRSNVVDPLVQKTSNITSRLYWRNEYKLVITCPDYEGDGQYRVYARFAVLDENLNSVVIDDMVRREGAPTPEIG